MATQREKLSFIEDLRTFGQERLRLEFDGSFKRYTARYRTANWLYVVCRDGLASALPKAETFRFAWDRARARRWERYYRARNRDTYLYSAEGHGGAACPITPSLLSAAPARQGYVVLHEAWHATLRLAKIQMPYALEEATGRVVGVIGTILFAQQRGDPDLLRDAEVQARDWGAFVRFVNRTHRQLRRFYSESHARRERARMFAGVRAAASALRKRTRSTWEREELTREMNNAFFFRYYDYARFYPLALKVCRQAGSLPRAMQYYMRAGRTGAVEQLARFARSHPIAATCSGRG
jgi:hypothetical protein